MAHRIFPTAGNLPVDAARSVNVGGRHQNSVMERELPPTLRYLIRRQSGVISRVQALQAGLSEDMVKFRISSDRWRRIHPGVYATFTGELSRWERLIRAIARELTDEARLQAAIKERQRLRWRADLQELIAAAAGGDHSVLEFRYHRDVERAHGLPESARQVPFTMPDGRRGRRDRVYEPYGVVIELDGRLAHQPEDQWKDKTRDNAAAAAGKQTLRYGWAQVKWEPCAIAAEVARVLRRHGWDGQPRTCSPGCVVKTE